MNSLDQIIEASFRNFHAKGLDYICLKRSVDLTVKVYFFDECCSCPEVVYPHDHRYDFSTKVICGTVANWVYRKDELGARFNCFRFYTPLNGGQGFVWDSEARLLRGSDTYCAGERYVSPFDAIHTITVQSDTILMLNQYTDLKAIDQPSFLYSKSNEPISLDGLYEKHTPDQILARLRLLDGLLGSSYFTEFARK